MAERASSLQISVVIPTCHRNDRLRRCLDRLAPGEQTLTAALYEVIVTDDGSQTTAKRLVTEEYPWARWLAGPCRGPAANRNHAAAFAAAPWLAFTDDDCLPALDWLESYLQAITPSVFVYEGRTICQKGLTSPLQSAPINLTGGFLWSCNILVKKAVFTEMGGFDERFPGPHLEDVDFRERLKSRGYIFPFVENAVVDHPPRRAPWGRQLAAFHESDIFYWYKSGNTKPISRARKLGATVRFRLIAIARAPLGFDSLSALCSLVIELWHVAGHIKQWERKYRQYMP